MSRATACELIRQTAGAGVREFCVCGGARNAVLLSVLAHSRGLRLWRFPEERCAGFFAIGRARALDRPVAVVTTSGTAAAELLPAVIEAHYQGVPLLVLTADRPARFRGTGAPQAIEQAGLFGPYATGIDVIGASDLGDSQARLDAWDQARPFHVNICLEEPVASDFEPAEGIECGFQSARRAKPAPADVIREFVQDAAGLVVLLGGLREAERDGLAEWLHRIACPVCAEATSGLREHPGLRDQMKLGATITDGSKDRSIPPPPKILRIGDVPVSRFWRDLEARPEIDVLSATRTGFPGLARRSAVCGIPDWRELPRANHGTPTAASMNPGDRAPGADVQPATNELQTEPRFIRALSELIPGGSLVFLGNSLPVREWNAFATFEDRSLRCHANRGANGIDGALSTFFGLSADEPESWCLAGDLTTLYDLAAPWILLQLPRARRRIVILNNGGGKIFRHVPGLRDLDRATWTLIENPHGLGFRNWAGFWGLDYHSAHSPDALTVPASESSVIEIRI